MQPCSAFCKSPVNVLSYFYNLKKFKKNNLQRKCSNARIKCKEMTFLTYPL